MALVDRYSGVIFDYGGVLASHQTAEDSERLSSIARIPTDLFHQLYWSERLAYDKGLMTAEDYWNDLAQRGDTEITPAQIKDLIDADNESWSRFDQTMYEFVQSLIDAGKRVAVLSNMPHELGLFLKTTTRAFTPFHHITLSYEVQSVKPEPHIYQHCLDGLGVSAKETLFLDDRIENVHGAESLGINAIQFTSRDEVLAKLKA
jgi:putative hydrolase of the HAD superfamily